MIYRGKCFLAVFLFVAGRAYTQERGIGGDGAKLYDGEKACSSTNYSILSDQIYTTEKLDVVERFSLSLRIFYKIWIPVQN